MTFYLFFVPFSALQKELHSQTMRLFLRLENGTNYGVKSYKYLLRLAYLLLIMIFVVTMSVSAKEFSCTKYSKLPVVFQACEGEGPCGYFRDDKALVRVPIYEQPFKTSKIIDYLGKGETIRETEPYLVVKKLGKVRVMTANNILRAKGIKKDDIVPLVKTNDEYQVEICVGDKVIEVNDVYEQFPDFVKIIEQNKTEAWVKLKTPRNVVGYALDISEPGADQWYIHILS